MLGGMEPHACSPNRHQVVKQLAMRATCRRSYANK
jgi:hypothetical protein